MLKNIWHSLQTKLTISFVALIVIVSALIFSFTLVETKNALKEVVRTELATLAGVIALDLSGTEAEQMQGLQQGSENSDMFRQLQQKLLAYQSVHPDIRYVYTMRKLGDRLVFMVDPMFGDPEDPGAAIGEVYENISDAMVAGLSGQAVETDFYSDKWGTLLSGYAPLRNTKGEYIGMVGVDILANTVLEKQDFIGATVYIIIGIAILIAVLFIFIFSKTIIKDIRRLNAVAEAISLGNMDVELTVVRKDEIGQLADSFGRMVASLKIMMME